jgi:multiple sugar transport system permease protein
MLHGKKLLLAQNNISLGGNCRMKLKITKKHSMENEPLVGLLFLLPSLLGCLVFYFFPVVFSLIISLFKWNLSIGANNLKFVGFQNYIGIFRDNIFTASLINTIIFTVSTVVIGISISLILAVLIAKTAFLKNAIKSMFFMPYISSIVAVSIVWMVLLQPSYGPVNQFLMSIGIQNPPKWFIDVHWALPSLIAMFIWQNLGYNVIVFAAGLSGISQDLYEAADIDGASGVRKFLAITVPMISPTTFFLSIMGIINSFKVFDQVQVITQGGPGTATSVLALYIYKEAFQFYQMGYASASAWVMLFIIFIVTVIQWKQQKGWVVYD